MGQIGEIPIWMAIIDKMYTDQVDHNLFPQYCNMEFDDGASTPKEWSCNLFPHQENENENCCKLERALSHYCLVQSIFNVWWNKICLNQENEIECIASSLLLTNAKSTDSKISFWTKITISNWLLLSILHIISSKMQIDLFFEINPKHYCEESFCSQPIAHKAHSTAHCMRFDHWN